MAEILKVLFQAKPIAATWTDTYVVPALRSAVISTIVVCNQSSTATAFRIAVAVSGAATDPSQNLYYDVAIPGNDTFVATIGLTLAATDLIRVYNTAATCSFQIFGSEVT